MLNKSIILIALLFVFAGCTSVSTVASVSEDQEVKKALDGFYASLNAMLQGNPEPAKSYH